MKKGDSAFDGMSQLEIAHRLGITKQRVTQLEKRAMRKMRAVLESEGKTLDDFLRDASNAISKAAPKKTVHT